MGGERKKEREIPRGYSGNGEKAVTMDSGDGGQLWTAVMIRDLGVSEG